jgi:putative ABC transport system permease protein
MRLLRGRGIERTDRGGAPGVVVINGATARRYWPDEDPLGRRFELGGGAGPGWVTIVGIVADVRHGGLGEPAMPQMYLAHEQFRFWGSGAPVRAMSLAVRGDDPATVAAMVRAEVRALDAQMPVGELRTMSSIRARSLARPRFTMLLLGLFSSVALALAAVGIYGVMAQAVTRRTREIGIRMALGAGQTSVAAMVLRQGMTLALVGLVLGLGGALALTRLLRGLLYEVSPTDPLTLGAGVAFLAVVALLATWLPARRVGLSGRRRRSRSPRRPSP